MQLNSAQIDLSSMIWILVADEEQAIVYRYHKNKEIIPMHDSMRRPYNEMIKSHDLTPVEGMTFQAESLKNFETRRDERGSLIEQQYSGDHTREPYDAVCDEIAQNMVTKVARKLDHYCKTKAFDNLVIAAPSKILGAFKQQLNPFTLKSVIGEIDKDFTKDRSHTLFEHLQDVFAAAHIR